MAILGIVALLGFSSLGSACQGFDADAKPRFGYDWQKLLHIEEVVYDNYGALQVHHVENPIANPVLNPVPADVADSISFLVELIRAHVQAGRLEVSRVVFQGFQQASQKLCETELTPGLMQQQMELHDDLETVARIADRIHRKQKTIYAFWADVDRDSADGSSRGRNRMALSLARIHLNELKKLNSVCAARLNAIQRKQARAEVLYQKILAECLLDDFKSIFGAGDKLKPEPEFPDDLIDGFEDPNDPDLLIRD